MGYEFDLLGSIKAQWEFLYYFVIFKRGPNVMCRNFEEIEADVLH